MVEKRLKDAGLSKREAEVATVVSEGLTNIETSKRLFVTEKTIKYHLTSIYKKLKIKSRSQLIIWCASHLYFKEDVVKPEEPSVYKHSYRLPKGNS